MSTFYFKTRVIDFAISTNNSLYFKNKSSNIVISYGEATSIDIAMFDKVAVDAYDDMKVDKISNQFFLDCFRNISEKDCIFVGAGFSKLCGIQDMADLHEMFCLEKPDQLLCMVRECPKVLISRYKLFVLKMALSKPSKEHYVLGEIQNTTNCRIITENIDDLLCKVKINHVNLFKDPIDFGPPNKVFLLGVGNPYFQSLLNKWDLQGTKFLALSLNRPNINISNLLWCESSISRIMLEYYVEISR